MKIKLYIYTIYTHTRKKRVRKTKTKEHAKKIPVNKYKRTKRTSVWQNYMNEKYEELFATYAMQMNHFMFTLNEDKIKICVYAHATFHSSICTEPIRHMQAIEKKP